MECLLYTGQSLVTQGPLIPHGPNLPCHVKIMVMTINPLFEALSFYFVAYAMDHQHQHHLQNTH